MEIGMKGVLDVNASILGNKANICEWLDFSLFFFINFCNVWTVTMGMFYFIVNKNYK